MYERNTHLEVFAQLSDLSQMEKINTAPTVSRTRGVLLFAFGSTKYGEMASNLARALKVTSSVFDANGRINSIPVTLICTAEAIATLNDTIRKTHFNEIRVMDKSIHSYKGNPRYYTRTKCLMYELSPYDDTIFLDVDTIWFPDNGNNINRLFDRLAQNKDDVMWQNSGVRNLLELAAANQRIDYWVAAADIVDKFEWKRPFMVQIHSYFVYFRKGEVAKNYFEHVINIHDRAAEKEFVFADWRQVVPDELCFSIAYGTAGLDITDDMQGFKPLFQQEDWPNMRPCSDLAKGKNRSEGEKQDSVRRTGKEGYYGATLVVEKPCNDWKVNWDSAYSQFFQGGHRYRRTGDPQCFQWKNKT